MSSAELIEVRCSGCGQAYQLPPPSADQRAQCRRCGEQFTIARSVVGRRVAPPASERRYAAEERLAGANIASRAATFRRTDSLPAAWKPTLNWRRALPIIAVLCLLAAGLVAGLWVRSAITGRPPGSQTLARGRIAKLSPPRNSYEYNSVSDLIESLEPAVVQVRTNRGLGSGFVIDSRGLIVTCHHCIDRVTHAKVIFANGREFQVVGVRAIDPGADQAILEIACDQPLPSLPLADALPKKGEPVVAFGSPLGLSFTASEGSIGAHRTLAEVLDTSRLLGESLSQRNVGTQLVQFTANAMPGHSGGPVVDFRGNVVGMAAMSVPFRGSSFEFAVACTEIARLAHYLEPEPIPLADLLAPPEEDALKADPLPKIQK